MSSGHLRGYVDVISKTVISGWAEDPASDDPAALKVLVNDREVAVTVCTAIRQDVFDAGFRKGRSFHFNPIRFLSDGVNAIEVRFAPTDELVPHGSASVEYDQAQHIADHWSSMYQDKHHYITRWWQCERIVRHVNNKVCGESIPGLSHGLYQRIRNRFRDRLPFRKAVSVGCGEAIKEIDFVQLGLAESFELYELSPYAIEQGTQHVAAAGLTGQMTYHLRDPFRSADSESCYDVVFWNNSLHHMFDVNEAIEWSRKALKPAGLFVMDEFVGPTYMQWSDRLLEINTRVREQMPSKYLVDPRDRERTLPTTMGRPNIDEFCAIDPSECVDSAVLESLRNHFANLEVIPTGGGVYHLALNDVLHNILEAGDSQLLDRMLQLDDQLIELGETHYSVAIGVRD